MRWPTGDCKGMQEFLLRLTTLIDIESILPQSTYHRLALKVLGQVQLTARIAQPFSQILSLATHPIIKIEPQNQDNAQMFLSLCLVCEKV